MVAPELNEPAVLDTQDQHRPFTLQRLVADPAYDLDQRHREPVIGQRVLQLEPGRPSRPLGEPAAKKPNTAFLPW
jgi:hypothetical protein